MLENARKGDRMAKILTYTEALTLLELVKIASEQLKEHGRYVGEEWSWSDWEQKADEILNQTKPETTQREAIAAVQHEIWAHWMRYLFSVSPKNADGSVNIPVDKVYRWKRQMRMPYALLTDAERDSDREQADKVLAVKNYDRC